VRERSSSVSIFGFVRGSPGVLIYCVLGGLFIKSLFCFSCDSNYIRIMTTLWLAWSCL